MLASWSPFDGASQLAEAQLASARVELATAAADAAVDQARLETSRSLASLRAALARLEIATRAVAQSREAHRIVTRKYEGGLATVVHVPQMQAVMSRPLRSHSLSLPQRMPGKPKIVQ